MTAKAQIKALKKQIRRHDYLYYSADRPEILDSEYDRLFARLKALEAENPVLVTKDSPTQRVSGRPVKGFRKVRHGRPMLSINSVYSNVDAMREWAEGLGRTEYVVELKIDGLALNLRYEKGILVRAATRGDGETGNDVMANARMIKTIPSKIIGKAPDVLEVRGEVYMPKKVFEELNKHRKKSGKKPFANPRNAASGSLQQKTPQITADRRLAFFAFDTGECSEIFAENQWERLIKLNNSGFCVNRHARKAKDIKTAINICMEWTDKRVQLDYWIDGMVIKVNKLYQQSISETDGRNWNWCVSYKFPSAQARTTVKAIIIQTGKKGKKTPIAELEPIQLEGTIIKRVNLYNSDEVRRLRIREGCAVLIEKIGGIIPKIVAVF